MAGNLGDAVLTLSTDSSKLDAGIKSAQEKAKDIGATFVKAGAAISAIGLPFALAAKSAITTAGNFADMSQKVGVSVESLSGLAHAAKLSGSDIDSLGIGLKRLSGNALDASRGMEGPAKAFDALQISATNVDGTLKNTDQILLEVADRFAQMEDGTAKTAIAMDLFGRSGADLIPLLNEGSAGIKGMTDEAGRLGLVLSTEGAQSAEKFGDSIDKLKGAFTGIFNVLVDSGLLDRLTELVTNIADGTAAFAKAHPEWTKAGVGLGLVAAAVGPVVIAVGFMIPAITGGITAIKGMTAAAGGLNGSLLALGKGAGFAAVIAALAVQTEAVKQASKWTASFAEGPMLALWEKLGLVDQRQVELTKKTADYARALIPTAENAVKLAAAVNAGLEPKRQAAIAAKAFQENLDKLAAAANAAAPSVGNLRQEVERFDLAKTIQGIDEAAAATLKFKGEVMAAAVAAAGLPPEFDAIAGAANGARDPVVALGIGLEKTAADLENFGNASKSLGGFSKRTQDAINPVINLGKEVKVTTTATGLWDKGLKQVSTVLTDLGNDLSGRFSAAIKTGIGPLDDFTKAIIRLVSEKVMGAMIKGLADIIGHIPGLSKLAGILTGIGGGAASGAAGAAGSAAGSVGGAAGGVGGAAGGAGAAAGSTLMNALTMVGSLGSMVSGFISNFQNAKMETTLNAIESNTRKSAIHLGEGDSSILHWTQSSQAILWIIANNTAAMLKDGIALASGTTATLTKNAAEQVAATEAATEAIDTGLNVVTEVVRSLEQRVASGDLRSADAIQMVTDTLAQNLDKTTQAIAFVQKALDAVPLWQRPALEAQLATLRQTEEGLRKASEAQIAELVRLGEGESLREVTAAIAFVQKALDAVPVWQKPALLGQLAVLQAIQASMIEANAAAAVANESAAAINAWLKSIPTNTAFPVRPGGYFGGVLVPNTTPRPGSSPHGRGTGPTDHSPLPPPLPAFQSGIDFLPQDTLALLHRGEAVIPAEENRRGAKQPVEIVLRLQSGKEIARQFIADINDLVGRNGERLLASAVRA